MYLSEILWILQVPIVKMDYAEPGFSCKEENTTEEKLRKCSPFLQNFLPQTAIFLLLFEK